MNHAAKILKILPYLKGQRVSINNRQYIGTIVKWTDKMLDLKDVTRRDAGFEYAYTLFLNTIHKI